jgi:hypothetical protein
VDHITISPGLLMQLKQPYAGNVKSLFDIAPALPIPARGVSFINDRGSYQITFARDQGGASQIKLTEVSTYTDRSLSFADKDQGHKYLL